ncbi:MAG: insulinase family protein [Alphaproteobacteria bacterium]|nr:insulinase family protein [Alphaproteobacteria bacterium]
MNKFFYTLLGLILILVYIVYRQNSINFDRIVAKSELKEKTFTKMPQEFVTEKGIKYWLIEDNQIELISLSFSFTKSGFAYDSDNKQGVSVLSAQMLGGGTKKYNYEDYHNLLQLNGIAIAFNTDKDDFTGYMTTPSNSKEQAFDILEQVLKEPLLDKNYLETLKNQFAVLVKTQKETPQSELGIKFKQTLYGNHPYARTVETMAESVASLKTDDIKEFLQNSLSRDNLIIGVAGNITPDEASKFIDKVFSQIKEKSDNKTLDAPKLNLTAQTIKIKRDTAQVISSFALKGVKRLDKDFYPLYIANHIFGGSGLTSRLSLETREKEGLTYGVYTYLVIDELSPLILGGFSCVEENYDKMKNLISEQMRKIAANGVNKKEFKAAKDYLLASYNLRFSSTLELSKMLNQMQKLNLGLDFLQKRNDYVKKVTLDEVNEAAKTYFNNLPIEVVIGLK